MLEDNLTPRQIVKELDRYIIGQDEAKRSVAVALRNRYRRKQLTGELQEEIIPKNILMIGPTGIGKTEIARRLARLVNAPLLRWRPLNLPKWVCGAGCGVDDPRSRRDHIRIVRNERMEAVSNGRCWGAEERLLGCWRRCPERGAARLSPSVSVHPSTAPRKLG